MIKTSLSPIRWQWIAALTIVVGSLYGLNGRTLLLNPLLGLFLCIFLWFRNRPFTWRYDCLFFCLALTCAAAACPSRLLGTIVFTLIPVVVLYIATYVIILDRQLRKK